MVDKIRQELDNDKERRDNDDGEDNDDNEDNDNETVSGDNMFVCLFVCGAWLYSQFLSQCRQVFCCFVPVSERAIHILGLIEGQPRYTSGEKFVEGSAEEKI